MIFAKNNTVLTHNSTITFKAKERGLVYETDFTNFDLTTRS